MPAHAKLPRKLRHALVLRHPTPADIEPLAAFNARIHGSPSGPDERVAAWTRDLLNGQHPTVRLEDFTIVEDTASGEIVSSCCLLSQTWTYGGISFGVGRPELVGTDERYRKAGLVRVQFEELHRWSHQRGELVQAITGIPYFYRQFGYEMAVDLGNGKVGALPNLPTLKDGETEPYRLRLPLPADLPLMAELYQAGARRSLLSCGRDAALWQYNVFNRSEQNVDRLDWRMIETPAGEAVGYLGHPPYLWESYMAGTAFELRPGVPWNQVTASVLRYLWQTGQQMAERDAKKCTGYGLWLENSHPAYKVASEWLPRRREPYAWYVRVDDLPAFLQRISPVLEQRLAASAWCGYTGELKISFYRRGILLGMTNGKLTRLETWQPDHAEGGDAAFPPYTFYQLLFGYRTMEELEYAFPDCWAHENVRSLVDALFPKQDSIVYPVD